jgi:hypothetical protein
MSVFLSSWALASWNSSVRRLPLQLNQLEWKAQSGMVVADPPLLLLADSGSTWDDRPTVCRMSWAGATFRIDGGLTPTA